MLTTHYKADLAKQFYLTFEKDEEILWSARPGLKVFVLNSCLQCFYHLLRIVGVTVLCLLFFGERDAQWNVVAIIGLLTLMGVIGSVSITSEALELRKTTYLITNFSVLVLNESEFPPVKRIDIRNIQTKEIKRTIFDKRFKTSAIYLFSGETCYDEGEKEKKYDVLHGVTDAEYVVGLINWRAKSIQSC